MAASPDLIEREDALQGLGVSRLRKEDARFIRGKGTYIDDLKLPGMLFGAMVRSPYAHARIKSINKDKALAMPGVTAVLVADDLRPLGLHWMPTIGGDTQAVLADEKVCFQMQEIAMVIASDRYTAADAADMVEVEYEELPAIVDPHKAMDADAPIIREDIADKDEVSHGPRTHPNHIFTWEAGDKDATDAVFDNAEVTVKEEILNPRVHPCPIETCGCVASFDKVTGKLTVNVTSQVPHLFRTVVAMLSGIPESKIRIISSDIGGGFGNKVPIYPGYVIAIVASIVTGVPIKWIESRIENISQQDLPATITASANLPQTRTAASRRCDFSHSPTTGLSIRMYRQPCCRQDSSASARVPTTYPRRIAGSMRSIPTRRPAGWPIAARCESPKRST